MIDPVKILKRAWEILWSYRALWVFGLILALATGGSVGNGSGNNGVRYDQNNHNQQTSPQSIQEAWHVFQSEIHKLFTQGIPEAHITGAQLSAFLWVVGGFILLMIVLGIIMAVARYVSETAVIRMVDEYEASGNKMTIREGFRAGWSKKAWQLFLIDLIVSLPAITLMLVLLVAGVLIYFSVVSGNQGFAAFSVVSTVVLIFITIFVVVVLSILLKLLREFFWRVCALEDAGVRESLQRGFAMVLENWKNVGLMWLVMIGLGIVWIFASLLLIIVSIPVVLVTAVVAALVSALPYLLLVGIFSTFLGSFLPWVAAALFIAPLFFTLAFSPWALLGSWQATYTSSVWTLTYREIKALPAILPQPVEEPVGE